MDGSYESNNSATLSKNFRISIRKAICDERRWKAGQEFFLVPKVCGMLMVAVPTLADLVGIAKDADASDHRDRCDRF